MMKNGVLLFSLRRKKKKYKKVNGVKIKFLKDGLTTTANIKVVKVRTGNIME